MNNNNYNDLSSRTKDKYNTLSPVLGEKTMDVVLNLKPRGENSFTNILNKIYQIKECNHKNRRYFDAIYDAFELNQEYTCESIVSTIAEIRRDHNLSPYVSSIKKYCEQDLFKLFIIENVYSEEDVKKKNVIGYKPIITLMPGA